MSIGPNLDTALYEWKRQNYEARERECWSIDAILRDNIN